MDTGETVGTDGGSVRFAGITRDEKEPYDQYQRGECPDGETDSRNQPEMKKIEGTSVTLGSFNRYHPRSTAPGPAWVTRSPG